MQSTISQAYAFTEYTPLEYLKIDIANNYGDTLINGEMVDLDKVNYEERIRWFDEQEQAGTLADLIESADKPALYYAGLLAYSKALDGEPSGYPVSMDACSSGLQILAALANCEKSALRCGVLPTGQREDAYMSLFEDMVSQYPGELHASRKDLKQAVMTSLYGSTAMPKKLFGDGTQALELFYHIMETEIPGAWALNLALKSLWQPFAKEHIWTVPDGFEVCMHVTDVETYEVMLNGSSVPVHIKENKGTKQGRSLSPNIIHSLDGMLVREMTRRCNYDTKQVSKVEQLCEHVLRSGNRRKSSTGRNRDKDQMLKRLWKLYVSSGFLSARVLDYIDEGNIGLVSARAVKKLIDSMPKKPFQIMAVHDCFRALPNYCNDLRKQYALLLSLLAESDVLSDIATQITGMKQQLQKVGNISNKIRDTDYALS